MTTRRSSSGARQHGHASDPVYVAAQGIQGTIITKKAGILTSPRARSLVFFLQGLSLPELAGNPNPGGLKRHAREFLKMFPERIGTPVMHRFGMKPGQIYNAEQVRAVRSEISAAWREAAPISRLEDFFNRTTHPGLPEMCSTWAGEGFPLRGDVEYECLFAELDGETMPKFVDNAPTSYPASLFVQVCKLILDAIIEQFLISLCTDPRLVIAAPGQALESATVEEDHLIQQFTDEELKGLRPASLPCFRDVVGALFEFQTRFEKKIEATFAETSIAREIFDTLDAGLRLRRIVMVNGIDGIGKSEAVRSWCARHLGEVRYVGLTGINNKTNFFRSIASALGLPAGESLNSGERQGRVEAMLQRSGLMLCIDEAHFMFKNSERSRATPEQIDWIDTALCNRGVPAALICTPQFITSMQQVQKRSGWNSGQFRRRLKRLTMLPDRPTKADLECVARKRLPKASSSVIKHLVGFAGGQQRHHLDTLNDAINEAEVIAGSLDKIAFCHVESATRGTLTQTALAKAQAFAVLGAKPGKPKRFASGNQPKRAGKPSASLLQREDLAADAAQNLGSLEELTPHPRGELTPV